MSYKFNTFMNHTCQQKYVHVSCDLAILRSATVMSVCEKSNGKKKKKMSCIKEKLICYNVKHGLKFGSLMLWELTNNKRCGTAVQLFDP